MSKSNGIKSLKQAAKLLNKHSPDGESLAYINKDEAKLLRSHGGSGIQTLSGVPTYGAIWDFFKPIIPDAWEPALESAGRMIKGLNPYAQPDEPIYNKKGNQINAPRSFVQDAMSVWVGLRAKKEQEGLNAAEMEQFNKLNQQLSAAKTEFDVSTDFGTELTAPEYETDITKSAAYTPIDFSGSATPDLTTTAVAQGGRIGAFNGGIQGLMPQQGFMPQPGLDPRMGYANAGEVENFNWGGPDMIEWASAREKGMDKDPLFASRIMKLEGEHERDVAEHEGAALFDKAWDLVNRGMAENINHALQMLRGEIEPQLPIGAAHGGRIGFNAGGSHKDWLTSKGYKDMMKGMSAAQITALYDSVRGTWSKAHGGRIGYMGGSGGPSGDKDLPFTVSKRMKKRLQDTHKWEFNKGQTNFKDFYEWFWDNPELNLGLKEGGRIGAQGGGIMPLLDMGGMEKDYRQDGGFVPIGRREKADDVPARLSKNEFVFTADAVKAAGGGDIDEGAQRMYNVMKNLEAGGEISEQSQGQG
jgi:hypothetical protein